MEDRFRFRGWDKGHELGPAKGMTYYTVYDAVGDVDVVMQCTGLKDKNGELIYEGDVLSLPAFYPKEMQVVFIEGAFCLGNKDGKYVADIYYIDHGGKNKSEIIGNIYEHPHLLEKKS